MNTIVRGGQTTLHYIRMLKQVIKGLLRIGALVIVGFVLFGLYQSSISLYNLKIYFTYIYCKILTLFGLEQTKIIITNLSGYSDSYKVIDIASNHEVVSTFNYINNKIQSLSFIGGKYAIIIIILMIITFLIRGSLLTKKKILKGQRLYKPIELKIKITINNLFENLFDFKFLYDYIALNIIITYNFLIFLSIKFLNLFLSIINILLYLLKRKKIKDIKSKCFITKVTANIKLLKSLFPIKIVNIPYPRNTQKTHTIITGTSGSGKTNEIKKMIAQVRQQNGKAIIYDRTGDLTKSFYDPKQDVLLNPLDARSANWNLLSEIVKDSHFDSMASAFIPEKNSSDPFWVDAPKSVLSEVMLIFKKVFKDLKSDNKINNQFLKDFFFGNNNKFQKLIESSGLLKRTLDQKSDKTAASIMVIMTTAIRSLKYLRDSNDQEFSIRKWISDDSQKGFLIIPSRADQHDAIKPLITIFLETAINTLLSLNQNDKRNIWIFLDELASLHQIPSFKSLLKEGRQFGASMVLGLQEMSDLKEIYGNSAATAISSLCNTRLIFSTPDRQTARWCSESLGKVVTQRTTESFTYGSHDMRDGVSINRQIAEEELAIDSQIMNLPPLNCYVRFSKGFGSARTESKFMQFPEISPSFIEAEINDVKIDKKILDLFENKQVKKDNKEVQINNIEDDLDFEDENDDNTFA